MVSDTFLTAVVPNGALTGFVTVSTPSGPLTSNVPYRVRPQLTSFYPPSGSIGSTVTITGVSLTQTTKVPIGGVKTSFTVVNDSTVNVIVPSDAVSGKIAITTQGDGATSTAIFTVT